MKTISVFCRGGSTVSLCLVLVMLAVCFQSRAQLDSPYTYLNDAELYTGYFYPKAFNALTVPDGTDYPECSYQEFTQVWHQLQQAQLGNDFPNLASLRTNSSAQYTYVPIFMADLDMHDFDSTAFIENEIVFTDGFFHDLTNEFNAPYVVRHALAAGFMLSELYGAEQKFSLPASNYFTNLPLPEIIEMDFDDGLGFRTVGLGQIVDVVYSDLNAAEPVQKWLRIRISRDGQELYAGMRFQIRAGGSDHPHLPPTEWISEGKFDNEDLPWQFSVFTNNRTIRANAYTLWSDDGVLDKPFIFVEGIDFTNEHWPLRNGGFGWDEFRTGASGYNFLTDMTGLLDQLQDHGYDIILLDFWKGDDWIGDNAMLLVELIELVNATKSGNESIVLAGASMGGQVTRFALRYMELNNMDHCTRLWISLDSPHLGANLPLSLQESLKWLASYKSEAETFMNEYLLEPAARQMLNVQSQPLDVRDAWYDQLAEMGWPEDVRSVGIANGNGFGQGPGIYPGQPLIQYDCSESLTDPLVRFHMYALPGEVHVNPNPPFEPYYKIAEVIITESPEGFWSYVQNGFNEQFGTIIQNGQYLDVENYDTAPGGLRNSMAAFVGAVNDDLSPCGQISSYVEYHPFIPTVSALAMEDVPVSSNVDEVLTGNPELTPFDEVYYPGGNTNQVHSTLSDDPGGNIDFTMAQVLNGEDHMGGELTASSPSDGVFNYGANGDFLLHGVHVHDGGVLLVNADIPYFHFDLGGQHSGHVDMSTTACGSSVLINNGGTMKIGDLYSPYTASLRIRGNTTVEIGSGGQLDIHPNSSVRIESGGSLILSGGQLRLSDGAVLEIQEGGKLYIGADTDITSITGNGQLSVLGEIIFTENYADLSSNSDSSSGVTWSFENQTTHVYGNFSNKLILKSTSPDHLVAEIGYGAWMRPDWQLGELEVQGGRVIVNGELQGICKTDFDNVRFEGNGVVRIEAINDIDNCEFDGVEVHSVFTSNLVLHLDLCEFQSGGRVQVNGGGFVIRNSEFGPGSVAAAVKGHNLTLPSAIHQSSFFSTNEAVFDDSNVDLTLRMCTFSGNQIGVQKVGGRLNLRCNSFLDSDWYAVIAGQYCWLNMSSNHAAGYNQFSGNEVNVLLEEASAIDLAKGYNTLAGFGAMNIQGKLAGRYCQTGSAVNVQLNASHNAWTAGAVPVAPQLQYIDISTWNGCNVMVTDPFPQVSSSCGQHDSGVIHPVKSISVNGQGLGGLERTSLFKDGEVDPGEPMIYTADIDGLQLSEALAQAAGHCTAWNDQGDDMEAVNLFHQILTYPLDRTNPEVRWKTRWGHRYMKIAVESLVQSGLAEAIGEEDTFGPHMWKYVEVLNAMTDTLITDSTYTDQFYLEMDKAQMFRLTGNLTMCEQLLLATDNCQLDSLEQAHLNFWLGRVHQEMALVEDLEDHIQDQSVNAVDSTSFEPAIQFVANQYYFGAHILGPESVTYAVCGNEGYKSTVDQTIMEIYPNPAKGAMRISIPGADVKQVDLLDSRGRFIRTLAAGESPFNGELNVGKDIESGTYLVRVFTPSSVIIGRVVLLM